MNKSIMHVSFLTDNMEEMIKFYTEKLGFTLKVLTRYRQYLNRDDRPKQKAIALEDPDRIFNAYLEACDGQFVELLSASDGLNPHEGFNAALGFSHFALLVDDIHEAYEEFQRKGIDTTSGISKGPSGTYQFWAHDPDMNFFEVMQFTDESYQVTGHIDN